MSKKPMLLLRDQTLIFIDVETSGLTPTVHEVLQIAVIRDDPTTGMVTRYETKIKPTRIGWAEPKALEVNGYTPEAWADSPSAKDVLTELKPWLEDGILVGHNVAFDRAFLEELFARHKDSIKLPHRTLDTYGLAYEHLAPCGLESLALDVIRKFLRWPLVGGHEAMRDAEDCRKLYHTLSRASWMKRAWWAFRNWFGKRLHKQEPSA